MNDNTKAKFNRVWLALDELVTAWESDDTAQDSFDNFVVEGGSWNVPSLDEVHAEFGAYVAWLNSRA